MADLKADFRIDPRLRGQGDVWKGEPAPDVASREELLAEQQTPQARAAWAEMRQMFDGMNSQEIAPSAGLTIQSESISSEPDGNRINLILMRPTVVTKPLACAYYIHGGAMQILSAYDGHNQTWGRMLAAEGIAVVMVDFRNALLPSSSLEVAPFPAGLNDCISGLTWLNANASRLGIDARRVIVVGDSGGGNLALASGLRLVRDRRQSLVKGIYALCPFISGKWPRAEFPSSISNNGILMDLHNNRAAMAYGIEAFQARDPLAWPAFASDADVQGYPPTTVTVNECDPLRDEGLAFYRLLLRNGVSAQCREIMGTTHAADMFPLLCEDISRDTIRSIAQFAKH